MAQVQSSGSSAVASEGGVAVGSITVGGNVEGDIIVGNNNFKVNTNYGTIIYKQAAPQARLRDAIPQPPRAPRGFVGRTKELGQLGRLIAANEAVSVYGPDGAGKSALLRQAATGDAARARPNGVVMLEGVDERGEALGLEDVIQRLFDALFESDPPLKVNATTARTYLSNTRPLVVLDNVNLPSAALASLPDLFPQGALLVTATRSPADDVMQPLKVDPLQRKESIQLLSARANLSVDAPRSTLDALCALLADVPLAIVTAANAIREVDLPLDRARAALASATPQSTDAMKAGVERAWALVNLTLSDNERQLLALAAAAPGVSVDPEWMRRMTLAPALRFGASAGVGGAEWVDAAMERLQALGLLRANSPRLRVEPGLRAMLRASLDEAVFKDRMADFMVREVSNRGLDWGFCADELGNLLGLIEWAAERRQWHPVVELCRGLDPYLCLHGLWDAWDAILNRALQASRAVGDRAHEAWALHQLGTHALGLGQDRHAINLLRQALDMRRALGDTVGMAYTQHNIDLLIPPAPPTRGGPEAPTRPSPKQREPARQPRRASRLGCMVALVILMGVIATAVYAVATGLLPVLPAQPDLPPSATYTPTPERAQPTTIPPTRTRTATPARGRAQPTTITPTHTRTASPTPRRALPISITPTVTRTPTRPPVSGGQAGPALTAPGLVYPVGNISIECPPDQIVKLSWTAASNRSDVRYAWELSNAPPGKPYAPFAQGSTTGLSDAVPISCDTWNTWHVRAVDRAGIVGPYSDYAAFYIRPVAPAQPADTTGPSISGPVAKPDPSYYFDQNCGGTTTTFNIQVTDPSGMKSVTFWYIYEGKGGFGEWQSTDMNYFGGDTLRNGEHTLTIDHETNRQAYTVLQGGDGLLHWSVVAYDALGNPTESRTVFGGDFVITILGCAPG